MFAQSFIKGIITDKYEKDYSLYVSPNLEEKLIALVSRKYDLNKDIEIESFTFLGQVIVVSDNNGYQYTISYSEL